MPLSSLFRILDLRGQLGKASMQLVDSEEAAAMVKRAEGLLEDALKVLDCHERWLSQREYKTFSIKHSRLLFRVVEIKRDVQDRDYRGKQSTTPAARQTLQTDAIQLYDKVRTFHTDVLTASRRAQEDADASDDAYDDDSPQPAPSQSSSPGTTWYSVVVPSEKSETSSISSSATSTIVEPCVAMTCLRDGNSGEGDGKVYRRTLILESMDKRVVMIDSTPRTAEEGAAPLNESTLVEISRAAEVMLATTNPENLDGYKLLGNQQEPPWLDTMVRHHGPEHAKAGGGVDGDMC